MVSSTLLLYRFFSQCCEYGVRSLLLNPYVGQMRGKSRKEVPVRLTHEYSSILSIDSSYRINAPSYTFLDSVKYYYD